MSEFLSVLKSLSLALFPKRCEFCGEVIELEQNLCDDCKSLPSVQLPACEKCGLGKDECSCKKKGNEYKRITAPYYYDESVVRAVLNFKQNEMPFLSKRFANDITASINNSYKDIDFDIITFVPLRKFHKRKRGYNQSELLANEISKLINVPVLDILIKVRDTGIQHLKSAKDREVDIFGAFDVIDEYKFNLNGKRILLIDDVKTTGSTLNECAKMLKIYGAKEVDCAVLTVAKRYK